MNQNWKIDYYKTLSGAEPIYDFIEKLPLKTKAKIYNTFELLTEFSTHLQPPHAKKLTGTPLWELRILGENSIRIFYLAMTGKTFLVLHGFIKKTQKTPRQEIVTALKRLREYLSRTQMTS